MSGHFIYFLPGLTRDTATLEAVRKTLLAGPLEDRLRNPKAFGALSITNVVNGPEGQAGVAVAATPTTCEPFHPTNYQPQRQTWRNVGTHWIGWDNESPPTPEGLARDRITPGYEVVLADERAWVAPVIRPYLSDQKTFDCTLSMVWGMDDKGQTALRIASRHRRLWDATQQLIGYYLSQQSLTKLDLFTLAADCLGMNYRVGRTELEALELCEDQHIEAVWRAAIDADLVEEAIARLSDPKADPPAPDSASSTAGQPAG